MSSDISSRNEMDDVTNENALDVDQVVEKLEKKHRPMDPDLVDLQKVDGFLQQLPYFDKIKANAFASFETIKQNLSETLATNEYRPGLVHWTNRLVSFIHEYGLFFTKSDHLKLIDIYMNLMLTPNLDLSTVDLCFSVLNELLKYF